MKVLSIRRVTNDRRHNAFTGACWFKGDLYVGYRQGDDHMCDQGRLIIQRSRDAGITWDTVTVLRGDGDTRDAHLYTDGARLFAVGHEEIETGEYGISGFASTEDGDRWTPWTRYEGCGHYVLWRPIAYRGKHYCAGYLRPRPFGVHWFESDDGHTWKDVRVVFESEEEKPNECYLEILPDGTATMIMRCEGGFVPKHPYICRSAYPFESWEMEKLTDLTLTGPALWTVDGRVYISGRWHPLHEDMHLEEDSVAHHAIFRVKDGKTYLLCVLPSGPKPDHSYMGVARRPDNHHRFSLSFYGNAVAQEDPAIDQWIHPQIYLADVLHRAEFIDEFLVSALVETEQGIEGATLPDAKSGGLKLDTVTTPEHQDPFDVRDRIEERTGLVYFVKDVEVGPWDHVDIHLGHDGPVKVWWNGEEVFAGPGTIPAAQDTTSLHLPSKHGTNRLAIAMDTNHGKAGTLFARWDRAWEPAGVVSRPA